MITYDKIYTDNPFIDELIYFTKTIAVNAVIKDCDKADAAETVASLKASDIYIACVEGRPRFEQFIYDFSFLYRSNILPPSLLEICTKDNTLIPEVYRDELTKARAIEYIEKYEEQNNYYRTLIGLPPIEATPDDFIYFTEDDLAGLPPLMYPTLPVHAMTKEDLTILYSHGVIDNLIKQNPDKPYLKFMSDNAINLYKARKALPFQILHIPTVANNELMDRWNSKYEQNRTYTLKTYYSEAYKMFSDYYNNFIMVFIILQTMLDIISEVQEFIARRDIFDDRSIRYLFESYGIPYYPEIPRKYQIAMVKNINTLLKWKASTKNMIDICSLFGFDEIDIFRYYLLRDRRIKLDEDYDKTNDEYEFHYKTIIDENGEEKIVPDNDKNYELKFVRVPIEDKADNYLKDKTAYEDYDIITSQDEFWDGSSGDEYDNKDDQHRAVKSAILDQEFSYTRTKYISIDTMYELTEMAFDLPYFINMLVDNNLKEDYLYVNIPTIKNNHQFRVNDLFVYMMALSHIYHGFEDNITQSRSNILTILGFNFQVDLPALQTDLENKYYLDFSKEYYRENYEGIINSIEGFDLSKTEITTFGRLMDIFTKNKKIWITASEGMLHADNKRIYECYKKIYDACFIQEYTETFFTLHDGTIAKTYTEFLQQRDYVLYQSLENFKSYDKSSSVQTPIANILIEIAYVLDEYMDSENFKYILSKFPAISGDFVRTYMIKIVNFFKSYKVHLLNISTVYKVFDKRENSIKIYDDWIMNVKTNPTDYSTIIEEISYDNNLSKSDKVMLLEQIKFEIERWEFRDLNDKYDFIDKINTIITELTLSDKVIIDDMKFPFHELEYTYDRNDRFYTLDSIHPEVNKTIKDNYTILEQIKISYEKD